jgi:hypothetical protein
MSLLILILFVTDFAPIVPRSIKIFVRTIVPPGARFATYEITIPINTDETAIIIDINAVFLNPFPNIIAVTFGITINEEISRTPTKRTDAIRAKLARLIKR